MEELKDDDFELLLLSTQELYDKYWAQCIPHLERVVATNDGEFTVDDLYRLAIQGKSYTIIAKNDTPEIPEVRMVIVLEIVQHPQYSLLNVMALGGNNIQPLIKLFWKDVCGWARVCGVSRFECKVPSPTLEKLVSIAGFKQKYTIMRQSLKEPHDDKPCD